MQFTDIVHIYEWDSFTQNNCNTYLIGKKGRVLIDPGHRHLFTNVAGGMRKDGFDPDRVDMVLATHSHPDHFESVENFMDKIDVKIALHPEEQHFLEKAGMEFARMLGMPTPRYRVDLDLVEGNLTADGVTLKVFHTPGHSPGHVCFYLEEEKILFAGDLIFNQGVGRTDFPGGDGDLLKNSIRRMAELDIETILSGHGPMVQGREAVKSNFDFIEKVYFPMV